MAFNGSTGQGAFLLFQIKKPLSTIKKPEIENNKTLYLDNKIKKGKFDSSPANMAPAPKATNNAGKAQQTNVPRLVKRLMEGIIRFLIEIGFTLYTLIYFFHSVTSVFK